MRKIFLISAGILISQGSLFSKTEQFVLGDSVVSEIGRAHV